MTALASVQHEIGDFGEEYELPEGSIPKMIAHAMAGGLASELAVGEFADGAMAAALAELTGPLLGGTDLDEGTQVELQRLIGATAVLLRGSDVDGVMFAGGVAAAVEQYNRQLHRNEQKILASMLGRDVDGEDVFDGDLNALTDYERRVLAAACAQIHCADHLNADDPAYAQRQALQERGFELRRAEDAVFLSLEEARNKYLKESGARVLINPLTITSLHQYNVGSSGQAQGGFLYTGYDARHDIMLATGVDIYGQARAESGPFGVVDDVADVAIGLYKAFVATVDCTMNTEACDVLLDKVVGAVKGTVEKIRDLEHYPELLKNTDLAVARFIDGKISREEFATVLADAGHIAGTAESVLVGLGLSTLGRGTLLGGRVGSAEPDTEPN